MISRNPLVIVKHPITIHCSLIVIGGELRRRELLLVGADHSFKFDNEEIRESK